MKQFAIIGLGKFGRRMIDELSEAGCELLVIDRSAEAVDEYKDRVAACYVADAISEDVVTRLVPAGLDAAVEGSRLAEGQLQSAESRLSTLSRVHEQRDWTSSGVRISASANGMADFERTRAISRRNGLQKYVYPASSLSCWIDSRGFQEATTWVPSTMYGSMATPVTV